MFNLRALISDKDRASVANAPVNKIDDIYMPSMVVGSGFENIIVSKELCLEIPILSRARNMICNLITSLDMHIIKKSHDGQIIDICDSRTRLINSQQGKQILRNLLEDRLIYGSGYAYAKWDFNKITDIISLDTISMSVVPYSFDPLNPKYYLQYQGHEVDINNVIRLLNGYSRDGGLSGEGGWINASEVLKTYWKTLNDCKKITSQSNVDYQVTDTKVTKEAMQKFNNDLAEAERTGRKIILNKGITKSDAGNRTAQELQFMELFNKLDDELCVLCDINKSVIMGTAQNDQYNQWIRSVIAAEIKNLMLALEDVIILEHEKEQGITCYMDYRPLLHMSAKEESITWDNYVKMGAVSRNEVRSQLNMDRVDYLDGFVINQGEAILNTDTGMVYNVNMGKNIDIDNLKEGGGEDGDGTKEDE